MADKKPIDPEEEKAEKHVKEIMEPADSLYKTNPEPTTATEAESESASTTATAPEVAVKTTAEDATPFTVPVIALAEPDSETHVSAEPDLDLANSPDVSKDGNDGEDKGVDQAVDDILRGEADAALPDAELTETPVVMKESRWGKIKNALYNWWDNPKKRYGTLLGIAIVLGIIFGVPAIRANALNLIGVRSSVIVTAIDGTTNLPLEHVNVSASGIQAKTNADGVVRIKGVKLGQQDVTIAKAGFATVTKHISLGLRVQDFGEVSMKAIGTQYTLGLTDYLSGKPVANVAVSSGEATTKSDKTGKAILTVPPSDSSPIDITVGGTIYRKEKVSATENPTDVIQVKLVPAAPNVYVSKASGKYDVYKMDIDGKNKKVLLAGTGLETPNISLSLNDNNTYTALVSSRENKRNNEGYLLSTLSIVKVADGSTQTVDYSEQFILLGWKDNTLIYQQTIAGASAANASRQKIFSYDVESGRRYQLANANYFGGALLVGGKLYYVVSGTDPSAQGNFSVVDLNGSNRRTIMSGTIWSFTRTAYDKARLQKSDNSWYGYTFGDIATKTSVPPSSYTSRAYIDAPDGKTSLWVDVRDTNGVIMVHNVSDGMEKELLTQKYVTSIVRWLSPNVFVFRVSSPSETADYAANIDGGQPKLISEVSAVQGY